ncbi:MAG: transposase [Patescibacteria group bacterium]
MPYRKTLLVQDQIYHVFNRGVAGLPIFASVKDYSRFLELVDYYRFINTPFSFSHLKKKLEEKRKKILSDLKEKDETQAEILAYCLMNNHFHFLLKQLTKSGISSFMANLQNGYAKYFNIKTRRAGPLFQSIFKSVRIETDEQLLHVSRYIHLNPSTGYLVDANNLHTYKWSSLSEYLGEVTNNLSFISKDMILGLIGGADKYRQFVFDQAQYQRKLGLIKHLIIE